MTLKEQQAFARAIFAAARERGCEASEVLSALLCGWVYFDGTAMREPGFVALSPEATRAYLSDGTAWSESDVIQRFPANEPPEETTDHE